MDTITHRQLIVNRLRQVIDPEIGINIVDLGLVYDIQLKEDGVEIYFTATTPGCPMRRYLEQEIIRLVSSIPEIGEILVHIIWHPKWCIEMIAPEANIFNRNRNQSMPGL